MIRWYLCLFQLLFFQLSKIETGKYLTMIESKGFGNYARNDHV